MQWPALHNVANTIGKGLIDKDLVTPAVVFGALIGAMFWNVVTWLKGIPSSSSHALVGGIVGAGVAHAGFPSIQWIGLNKTLIAIVASPILGLVLTMGDHAPDELARSARERSRGGADISWVAPGFVGHIVAQPRPQRCSEDDGADHRSSLFDGLYERPFRGAQLGGALLLHRNGPWHPHRRLAGDRDDGYRITKLSQHQGFSASAGASIMLFAASALGIPVSTTHTVTGCVIGAGAARRASAVRWGIAGNVAVAWVITIPASATVAALFYWLISADFLRFGIAAALIAFVAYSARAWRIQT